MKKTLGLALILSAAVAVVPASRAAVPLVHVVTVGTDSSHAPPAQGLREAVEQLAAPGDIIHFAPGLVVELADTLTIDKTLVLEGPVTLRGRRGDTVVVKADRVQFHDVTFLDVQVRTATTNRGGGQFTGVADLEVSDCRFEGRTGIFLQRTTDASFIDCTAKPANGGDRVPLRLKSTTATYISRFTVDGGPASSLIDLDSEDLTLNGCDFAGDVRLATVSGELLDNKVRGTRGIVSVPSPTQLPKRPRNQDEPFLRFASNRALAMSVRGTGLLLDFNVLGDGALEAKRPKGAKRPYQIVLAVTPSDGGTPRGDVTLLQNEIFGGDTGIQLNGGPAGDYAPTTLTRNTVKGARNIGIRMTRVDDVVTDTNTIEGCGTDPGRVGGLEIFSTSGPSAVFSSDTILDTKGTGVLVRAAHDIVLSGQIVPRSSGNGIFVAKGRGKVLLDDETVNDSGLHGVRVDRGASVQLKNCTLTNSHGAGVFADVGALVLVRGGTFASNGGPGIDIAPAGPTPNDVPIQANRGIGFPEELAVDPETRVLSGVAAPGADVEVWVVGGASDDGNGEGTRHLGGSTCDAQGRFEFSFLPCDEGEKLTTTASFVDQGVTSEFSENIECPPRPDWFSVSSGTTRNLAAVWVLADDDAWAVGAGGSVLHWDGGGWRSVTSGTTEDLTDVVALGPNEVYVTAFDDLLRYDGSSWSVVYSLPGGTVFGNAVWGSPEAGVFAAWAVGQDVQVSSRQRFHRHPAGVETWVHPYFGEGQFGADRQGTPGSVFAGVWGLSANDVWCVTEGGSVFHYDGNSETKTEGSLPDHVGKFQRVLELLRGNNRDLWAGGGEVFTAGQAPFRFDGTNWTQQTFAITPQGTYSVWGNAPNDVWATADGPFQFAPGRNEAAIFHFDGTQWTRDEMPEKTPPLRRVRGVVGGLRVAVGDGGTILHHK